MRAERMMEQRQHGFRRCGEDRGGNRSTHYRKPSREPAQITDGYAFFRCLDGGFAPKALATSDSPHDPAGITGAAYDFTRSIWPA